MLVQAPKDSEEFPVNKYLIPHIAARVVDLCADHPSVTATFFCQDESCGKTICNHCVVTEHKTHDFVEISDENGRLKTVFIKKAERLREELKIKRRQIFKVKNRNAACLAQLQVSKVETVRKITESFDKMINFVASYIVEMDKKTNSEIDRLDRKLEWIETAKCFDTRPRHELRVLLSIVKEWAREPGKDFSKYYEFNKKTTEENAWRLCKYIEIQRKSIYEHTSSNNNQIKRITIPNHPIPTMKRSSPAQMGN